MFVKTKALIEYIYPRREREEVSSLGGGGFLKICLSIIDISDLLPKAKTVISKKCLESGVKKVFIIGLVLDVSENYGNVNTLAEFWRGHLEEKTCSSNRFA